MMDHHGGECERYVTELERDLAQALEALDKVMAERDLALHEAAYAHRAVENSQEAIAELEAKLTASERALAQAREDLATILKSADKAETEWTAQDQAYRADIESLRAALAELRGAHQHIMEIDLDVITGETAIRIAKNFSREALARAEGQGSQETRQICGEYVEGFGYCPHAIPCPAHQEQESRDE